MAEGQREMRRTRIEKRRRSVRVRPYEYEHEVRSFRDALDPRDPDIVRAKGLRLVRRDGTACS
ncbi:hypothetical protein [Streptomyces sp. NBC_00038]|uniref:hypothetical protein n=1 Tax=Streptomyces sp. NBC_00038 TaxID=2903615 RepID=UPI0022570CF2|nr:hypothetical protein [Streptomyces sp. NBC_00038]MCX5556791.1 hypothetical protein [Streptomyces sp. NBC_00038]